MHFSQVMVIRCADDNYTSSNELSKGLQAILSREMATVHFAPGGGFGSSLEWISNGSAMQKIWTSRLVVANKLGIKKIVLIDHLPCSAFEEAFGKLSPEEEKEQHIGAIRVVRAFFAELVPKMEFVTYLQTGNIFEKIP